MANIIIKFMVCVQYLMCAVSMFCHIMFVCEHIKIIICILKGPGENDKQTQISQK